MSSRANYTTVKQKLLDLSRENDLAIAFHPEGWPMTMEIKPYTGVGAQMSLLENLDNNGIGPDTVVTMTYTLEGAVVIDISDQFRISDALLSSFAKYFKKSCQAFSELVLDVIHANDRGVTRADLEKIEAAACSPGGM